MFHVEHFPTEAAQDPVAGIHPQGWSSMFQMFHVEHCAEPDKCQSHCSILDQDRRVDRRTSAAKWLVPVNASYPATMIVYPGEALFSSWLREVAGKSSAPTKLVPLVPVLRPLSVIASIAVLESAY